ncbi:hypothetical protein E2320_017993 [Naja naja]|nr:hypothetical protein E2320_017993 [Naja naja]
MAALPRDVRKHCGWECSQDSIGHFSSCVTVLAPKGARFLPVSLPSVGYVFVGFSVLPPPVPLLGLGLWILSAGNPHVPLGDEGICWMPTLMDGGLKDWPSLPLPQAASYRCSPSGNGRKGAAPKAKLDPWGYCLSSFLWLRGLRPSHRRTRDSG